MVRDAPVLDALTAHELTRGVEQYLVRIHVAVVVGDRHRLRIVNLLLTAVGQPVCVCEIQPTLGLSQPTVSHHLKQLVEAGIVGRETRGTYSYFSLVPGALASVRDVFKAPAACC